MTLRASTVRNLERPVAFATAARKVARIRGHYGDVGGWIRYSNGKPLVQGWDAYGRLMFARGYLAQDANHRGGNGKWYVWHPAFTEEESQRADALYGRE